MKIFLAVKHSLDPQFYYGGLWSGNFYPALRELGHEIIESKTDLLPASRFMHVASHFTPEEKRARSEITQKIVEEVKTTHRQKPIHLFLSYFYNAHFDPAGFDEIHRFGIPTINFYCNSIHQFEFVSEIARKANFSWYTEKEARPLYLKVGANPVWVQMGADPEVYHPISDGSRQTKACFVGQRYADRDRYLAKLIKAHVPVDIFGQGWKGHRNGRLSKISEDFYLGRRLLRPGTIGSYLQTIGQNFIEGGIFRGAARSFWQWQYQRESRGLDKILAEAVCGSAPGVCETFNQYEVILNFSHVWADGRPGSGSIPHVRLRDFEAPMCRTCYLTGHTEEITEFYEVGRAIDTYRGPEELMEKTKFYLTHPREAERLREAGYQRALRDHTWTRRFQQLFRQIGLPQPV